MSGPSNEPNGVLRVDKPRGPTSHDVVDKIRRLYQTRRVGHAGTLDPMATGLLIILIGRATKASDQLMAQDKTYEAELTLGIETDSQDAEGKVILTADVPTLSVEAIQTAMSGMLGPQDQTPPMHSAKKIGGIPLYRLAHRGETIARAARQITLHRFELLSWENPRLVFRVHCTKGTYVRTLGYDLAKRLGTVGHLSALRRTASGTLLAAGAATLDELAALDTAGRHQRLQEVTEIIPA
jgi:tRNA pseudouridine55 synthase